MSLRIRLLMEMARPAMKQHVRGALIYKRIRQLQDLRYKKSVRYKTFYADYASSEHHETGYVRRFRPMIFAPRRSRSLKKK